MPFWLGIGIVEHQEHGAGRSVRVGGDSFPSFDAAFERLAGIEPPAVAVQVTAANAYVIRAETMKEAFDLLIAVFELHETLPQVTLVVTGVETRQVKPEPPNQEVLSRLHGELCITHQITNLALSLAPGGDYRDQLVRHKEAIEDLGYGVRVIQAQVAGQEPPELPPRGSERLGCGPYHVGGSDSATLTSTLSSLATESSIAQHGARVAQNTLPGGKHRLDKLVAELSAFAATVDEHP